MGIYEDYSCPGNLNNADVHFRIYLDYIAYASSEWLTRDDYARLVIKYIFEISSISPNDDTIAYNEEYVENYEKLCPGYGDGIYYDASYTNTYASHSFYDVDFESGNTYRFKFGVWILAHARDAGGYVTSKIEVSFDSSHNNAEIEIRWQDRQTETPEMLSGPTKVGDVIKDGPQTRTYTTKTTDRDAKFVDEKIYYQLSIYENSTGHPYPESNWIGPFESGEKASLDITWDYIKRDDEGNIIPYNVRVRAKGSSYISYNSSWSEPLAVTVSHGKIYAYNNLIKIFSNRFLKLSQLFPLLKNLF
jgi:hypothetical protein